MRNPSAPVAIRRNDYQPPSHLIDTVELTFRLHAGEAEVTNRMVVRRNPKVEPEALVLNGVDLELVCLSVDGMTLTDNDFELTESQLTLPVAASEFVVEVVSAISPKNNTALEGLYQSSGNYCTQCEAEGFRKITWFLDRPDVLSRYSVRIEAERDACPIMLSNGNRVAEGELDAGRHFVEWEDPFPKPCYLFALVAGRLECLRDSYTTASGRDVALEIHVEAHNLHKCDYAMQALKASMAWDEQRYGLEYDLDIFMIVAVDDFNMGAMENKGLNIFNSKYVLADQQTATDADFMGVESVIAHEYFHNWTGNRVTCRDWFQLSLKEGLTVFRDQQFSADMNSAAVKRIEDVRLLRHHQFAEDAGPLAHPIRPDEYMEINNFYTVTVYEKGAEVIRMMHTLLGEERYRKGIDLYFERHDGQAVTCDDFVQAMEDASGVDLQQFRLWYSQAGTPLLNVTDSHDAATGRYSLHITQSVPATPGQSDKQPMHIPFALSLLAPDGTALPVNAGGDDESTVVLNITAAQSVFHFDDVFEKPIPSLLRDFSAPVRLESMLSDSDYTFLMANDSDPFNRWDAAQRLYRGVVEKLADGELSGADDPQLDDFYSAYSRLLANDSVDASLLAESMKLPGIEAVAEGHSIIRVDELDAAIESLRVALAKRNQTALLAFVNQPAKADYVVDSRAIGQRKLVNTCLGYLASLEPDIWLEKVMQRYESANNMTDRIVCVDVLANTGLPEREQVLNDFFANWSNDRLVIDKWFRIQAMARQDDILQQVKALTRHDAFDGNPNRIRSLVGAFASGNLRGFHQADGGGYDFVTGEVLRLNDINPQIAAGLVGPLCRWQRFDATRQRLMKEQLTRLTKHDGLSPDVFEKVHRSLQAD